MGVCLILLRDDAGGEMVNIVLQNLSCSQGLFPFLIDQTVLACYLPCSYSKVLTAAFHGNVLPESFLELVSCGVPNLPPVRSCQTAGILNCYRVQTLNTDSSYLEQEWYSSLPGLPCVYILCYNKYCRSCALQSLCPDKCPSPINGDGEIVQ